MPNIVCDCRFNFVGPRSYSATANSKFVKAMYYAVIVKLKFVGAQSCCVTAMSGFASARSYALTIKSAFVRPRWPQGTGPQGPIGPRIVICCLVDAELAFGGAALAFGMSGTASTWGAEPPSLNGGASQQPFLPATGPGGVLTL